MANANIVKVAFADIYMEDSNIDFMRFPAVFIDGDFDDDIDQYVKINNAPFDIDGAIFTVVYDGSATSYFVNTYTKTYDTTHTLWFQSYNYMRTLEMGYNNISVSTASTSNGFIMPIVVVDINGKMTITFRIFDMSSTPFTYTITDPVSGRVGYALATLNPTAVLPMTFITPRYISAFDTLLQNIVEIVEPTPPDDDPYSQGGNSESEGGEGDFADNGDAVNVPNLPSLSAADTGFITLFNPTLTQLKNLATYMWSNPLFDLDAWKKVIADPMDAILGLSIVPVNVPSGGSRNVTVGNISTGVSMTVASSQYVEVDCGTLNVKEFWGGYLDYSPYTQAEIYLPYCGIHPIAVDDIMNKSVHVVYHVDILSGACCAYVKCGDSVLYTFIGQCASSIPITGRNFTDMINGIINAATSIGTMVASGGLSAPMQASNAVNAISEIASTSVNVIKPSIEKSGAMGGTGGMLAIQKPYLILTRPRQAHPKSQNAFTGYPSFITEDLDNLSGYTEIEKIHLDNVPATHEELSEIERLLHEGVIL